MKTEIYGKTYYSLSCYYHRTSKNTWDWIELYQDDKNRLYAYVKHLVGKNRKWDGSKPFIRKANSWERKEIKRIGRDFFPRWSWRRVLMEMKHS